MGASRTPVLYAARALNTAHVLHIHINVRLSISSCQGHVIKHRFSGTLNSPICSESGINRTYILLGSIFIWNVDI